MTWREFKKLVEDSGVTDECIIDFIGEEMGWCSVKELDVNIYPDGELSKCQIIPV
ncbi:unnamed protein product [marine sediment metagenome]|uniref:Uncharacterized protein n=1 Tax=marine sediment metagenome TaxID=412755 RepID=X0SLT2_9ZZZZ